MKSLLLSMRNASFSLHRLNVCQDISMDLFAGEVTGLVYENDIERIAFIRLIEGKLPLDSGVCRRYMPKLKSNGADVWIVGEESNLFLSLPIGDQLFGLASGFKRKVVRNYQLQLRELFTRFGVSISVTARTEDLNDYERIQLELLMAYILKKKFIILSNFSSRLAADEIHKLWELIGEVRKSGFTFLILDNYENVLHRRADRVYVIKSGHMIQCLTKDEMNRNQWYLVLNPNQEPGRVREEAVYETQEMVFACKHGVTHLFADLNFEIHQGEICKFLYKDRKLAKHFADIFQGRADLKQGSLVYQGQPFQIASYEEALQAKIGFVPKNPTANLLFQNLPVKTNLFYPVSRKAPEVLKYFRFEKSIRHSLAEMIPPDSYHKKVKHLDPIGQINLVYAKWYLYVPKLLICINPFPNYNVEMDQVVEGWIARMAKRGTAVLILASNWPSHLSLKGEIHYIEEKMP